MSLATRALIGFGIGSGIFFGEIIAPVGIVGDAFIGLLQMTVLPYVTVSLILGLGQPLDCGRTVSELSSTIVNQRQTRLQQYPI
jgi:Na+/H+-dicarboxylate symporter